MRKPNSTICAAALVAALAVTSSGMLLGQQPTTAPAVLAEGSLPDLWRNFLHFIVLGRAEAVEGFGQAILNARPDPKELYTLWVNTDRSGLKMVRARGINKSIAAIADQLTAIINKGAKAVRMEPAEIARWIEMLGGGPREFQIGSERLIHAGEYAVPQIVDKLAEVRTSQVLRARLATVLPRLGKEAVRPLVEALAATDPSLREIICRALGRIGYAHAAPYLKELAERKHLLRRTRDAALGAVAATAGRGALKKPAAEMFYDLALKYYNRHDSVNPDARYNTANVWYWKEAGELTNVVVPRGIFNEIYAMRAARKALEHDETFYPAVTLWLAANLRKEANLPEGATDPTHPAGQPPASYYALSSGARYLQMVLARAMKDGDLIVAKGAITALEQTAGAKNLVQPVEGGAPSLVAALAYPVREIRYAAAAVLAEARPQKRFSGWNMVVPVLIEALRQSGVSSVTLADADLDRRNKVKDLLRGVNMDVFDDESFGKALQGARDAGGVDLVVIAAGIEGPDPAGAVAMLRGRAALRAVPVIVLAKATAMPAARRLARGDPLVFVWAVEELNAAGLGKILDKIGLTALPAARAAEWSIRAARCLGMLSMTRNPVYELGQAVPSLIAVLKDQRDKVRIAAAEALAQFRSPAAQQAIVDLANNAQAGKEVRLAAYAASAESVRMFGNILAEKQIRDVIAVTTGKGDMEIRKAAAKVLGALNLPSEKIMELIVSAK